jgi:hypothetical protein
MKNYFLIWKEFQEYSKNISPKTVTKVVKKQAGVTCVIPFAPSCICRHFPFARGMCLNASCALAYFWSWCPLSFFWLQLQTQSLGYDIKGWMLQILIVVVICHRALLSLKLEALNMMVGVNKSLINITNFD